MMSQFKTSEPIKCESLETAYAIFGDAWLFLKKTAFVLDNYETWCNVRNEAVEICIKYNRSRLASKVLVAVICEAERRSKNNSTYRIAKNADLPREAEIFSAIWKYYQHLYEGNEKTCFGDTPFEKDLYEVINSIDFVNAKVTVA